MKQESPTSHIDRYISELPDWRGETLAQLRKAILKADPAIVEEWKWMGSPVWCLDGNILVSNAHKEKVKLTFSHGAALSDRAKLFNNGLGGKVWRAIDVLEGDKIDEKALMALVREAVAFNRDRAKTRKVIKAKKPAE